ncbi:MAG: prephenate dehydrogenase [Lachnospiraceae bacterium]|nr:prephenate dehydrogenase [Lachnospiraceae bacterium]
MKLKTVGFIGLGLIGGSIAKALLNYDPSIQIYGHAFHKETLEEAFHEGVILNNDFLPLEKFGSFDLIFLCSPVKVNIHYLKELKPYLNENCLITDVGSVKGDIHAAVNALGLSHQFIGGHPMTGSEKIGFKNASSDLLENAYYIVTNDGCKDTTIINEFCDLIQSLGSIPLQLSCKEHDFATAAISHFPHIMSAALVNLVKDNETKEQTLKTIAAGGFKDITRISSSSPIMWQNICLENKEEILNLIELYKIQLKDFEEAIREGKEDKILSLFSDAKDYRDSLPLKKTGVLPVTYELYCDLKDETGGIAKIATLLASKNLSIKNIGIVNNREFEAGVLHIEMASSEDLALAKDLLQKNSYGVHTID